MLQMSESEKSYKRAFDEMESFISILYDEADPKNVDCEQSDLELAPMYQALTKIGERYEILEQIGKGGMKEIYRAFDLRSARHVAMAKPVSSLTKDNYDAFLREAHLTARLEHPCIVNLFDMGIDDGGIPFFTMELKKGRSLRELIRSARKNDSAEDFHLRKRLFIILRVCEAISYAHSRQVLHLDLKPENIQVGQFGEVQVCDWGMGVVVPRNEDGLNDSEILLDPDLYGPLMLHARGTLGYMAPEQRDPRSPKTIAMDIFALGCLLQELVTLELPDKAIRDQSAVDSPIKAIIAKARRDNPAERYSSVEELHQDLSRYIGGFSTSVERAGFLREVRLFYFRNRVPCLISILFLGLMAGSGIWFTKQLRDEHLKTEVAYAKSQESLLIAEEERSLANEARQRAEDAVAKHKRERELATVLLDRQIENSRAGAELLLDNLIMDNSLSLAAVENAFEHMDKALAEGAPNSDWFTAQKAYTLFLTQRFSEAEEYYAISVGDQSDLREIIPDFEKLVGENGILPVDDFIRLIQRIPATGRERNPLIEKMVVYDSLNRDSQLEKTRIIQAVLEMSNPNWRNQSFNFDSVSSHLSVSGEGFYSFFRKPALTGIDSAPNLNLLRMLNVRSIEIRSSSFADLAQLSELNLHRIDIRGTSVTELESLANISTLNMLVIEPDQFTSEQIVELPKRIAVEKRLL